MPYIFVYIFDYYITKTMFHKVILRVVMSKQFGLRNISSVAAAMLA